MLFNREKKRKRLQNELDEVEKKIRTFTQKVVSEGESKFKGMIKALQSIYGSFPEDVSLKKILNETDDSEVELLMNPILNSLVLTEEEKTKLLETAKNFMSNKAQPEQTTVIQEEIPEEKTVETIVPTADQDGGYKHSSRKSKSKSTRKRVKNKFKKIKIFSKKRSRKKKK